MNILLDTCAFVWYVQGNGDKLTAYELDLIESGHHSVFLSDVSVWEMAIKIGKGRLNLGYGLDVVILEMRVEGTIKLLPIQTSHCVGVQDLESIHRDPFDRLLITQAIFEDMYIMTSDSNMVRYSSVRAIKLK